MIPSEYRDILYVILKILNRSLKWRTVRFWTPTGSASTGRQSWTFKKNLRFSIKSNQWEFRNILYLILKVLNRPLKWGTVRLWTLTEFKNTSRQSLTFEKKPVLVLKRRFFSNIQLWRPVEADPVGVRRRALSHFKGLFKTVKMRYSTYLYSYWIGLKYPFQKSRFQAKTPWKTATVWHSFSLTVYIYT